MLAELWEALPPETSDSAWKKLPTRPTESPTATGDIAVILGRHASKVEILRNAIQSQNHDPDREPAWPFWHLSPEGATTIAETCHSGTLVYVEARFYAGVGTQASVGWADGALRHGPLAAPDAINRALRFLGVAAAGEKDEFETVGLGRRRATHEWS